MDFVQSAEVRVAELFVERMGAFIIPGPEGGGDLRLVLLLQSRRGGVGIGCAGRKKEPPGLAGGSALAGVALVY